MSEQSADGIEQEWGPEHPCFDGHCLNRDYVVLGRCDRCEEKIGKPIPKWVLEAMDHHYKDDPRVRGPEKIAAERVGSDRSVDTGKERDSDE